MKSPPIDYDTVREMLRTATPDRGLRFIGKGHPADIAVLFKGLDPAEVRQLFDVLFSSRRAAKTLKERLLSYCPTFSLCSTIKRLAV
jgi:hypothetical protein